MNAQSAFGIKNTAANNMIYANKLIDVKSLGTAGAAGGGGAAAAAAAQQQKPHNHGSRRLKAEQYKKKKKKMMDLTSSVGGM